jgi:RNA polymerase primary sigma factor
MAVRNSITTPSPVSETCLDNYFKDIRNNKPLTRAEEVELMTRIRKGETAAREQLIKANLRFVVGVSRNYQYQGLPLSDIINEGNLGLIRASMHFDETKNFKFISYAVWWIRQAILQALAEQSRIVRLPLNRSGTVYRISKASSKLEQHFQRKPHPSEIAQELGLHERVIRDTLAISDSHFSLDAPLKDDSASGLIDMIRDDKEETPDKHITGESFKGEIDRSLAQLSDRERAILKMYFGIGMDCAHTLDEIGIHFKLTRERIRQIKQKALDRLRKNGALERLIDDL